jgi:4-hydroxythreonine-4-phosphate dehydrogenase
VSLGDPSGIGPEVTAAALASRAVHRALVPVVFGDEGVFSRACRIAQVPDRLSRGQGLSHIDRPTLVPVTALPASKARPGHPSRDGAFAQLAYLERAADALRDGTLNGLCTAPLSKAQINRCGLAFTGHTEYLAERFRARVLMMLAGPRLRVAVSTTHLRVRDVPLALRSGEIRRDIELLSTSLREGLGIRRPRIAVCGLNPHAGEAGLFGDEEVRIIAPAIRAARRRGHDVTGPLAADGLFPRAAAGAFDAVLAMYHDQGLIPVKLLHFDEAVNVTLGLPVPRTSPDHGVAYDLAGTGRARHRSMEAALLLAARLARGTGAPSRR